MCQMSFCERLFIMACGLVKRFTKLFMIFFPLRYKYWGTFLTDVPFLWTGNGARVTEKS
ncbi:hypothetical protein DVU_0225 [Nitratidesulfovibrio vulgaris str. Hildenborough]|uniref:Uncharacterized protein n=1 Tax=Nitratidesulfovibrio vulgaris (strain ATCC 29579 / DSM 644 / CCUG 34227 / NCIMB 8303 / VKM B-1760 / Hildenborough) TaxID=882 RepID=Q72FI8_NITV2|nr:hypothetical protein DVU_0225 [Nitratidesulfovibrio vulgaris str. Hildenborough]